MITKNLSTLKINKLTQEQYDREHAAGNLDENAIYLTPDDESSNVGKKTLEGGEVFNDIDYNKAAALSSHAEGSATEALGIASHTEGVNTTASGQASHSEGTDNIAEGNHSHAEGRGNKAVGGQAHAEGYQTQALGTSSHAEGNQTIADAERSHAEGAYTKTYGRASHAEGNRSIAVGENAHAEGYQTTAFGKQSHDEGNSTDKGYTIIEELQNEMTNIPEEETFDDISFILDKYETSAQKFSLSYGDNSHSEGSDNLALGKNSHAEGSYSKAIGKNSHAEGTSKAIGDNSHSEGNQTTAEGISSSARNYKTTAKGDYSSAEGSKTTAYGLNSHSEGLSDNKALDYVGEVISDKDIPFEERTNFILEQYAENKFSLARGADSHVEGQNTLALGNHSHAEGNETIAQGSSSHSEGSGNKAQGDYSHAEGKNTLAKGTASHAEGYNTQANYNYSHAAGMYTHTNAEGQFVVGKYNSTSKDAVFIVGGGNDPDDKANALAVYPQGHEKGVTVLYTGSDNKSVTTKGYVDERIEGQLAISLNAWDKSLKNYIANNVAPALKIKKTGLGYVFADDVSPLKHDLSIKLSSDTIEDFSTVNIYRYGKNLFDLKTALHYSGHATASINLDKNTLTASSYSSDNARRAVNFLIRGAEYLVGKTITISAKAKIDIETTTAGIELAYFYKDELAERIKIPGLSIKATTRSSEYTTITATGVITELPSNINKPAELCIAFYSNAGDRILSDAYCSYTDIQVEIGDVASEYDISQISQYINSRESGNVIGLTSISPNMLLVSDTEGVTIELEYNSKNSASSGGGGNIDISGQITAITTDEINEICNTDLILSTDEGVVF